MKKLAELETKLGITLLPFQVEAYNSFFRYEAGLISAPTGSGKTLSLFLPIADYLREGGYIGCGTANVLWLTPLRALARDLEARLQRTAAGVKSNITVRLRTGDTSSKERAELRASPPDVLITTPESGHVLISQADQCDVLSGVQVVVVDEWHEFLGTKRGVQVELLLSYLRAKNQQLKVWGLSATLGNLSYACSVLSAGSSEKVVRASDIRRKVRLEVLLPDSIERFPWAGHIGLRLLPQVMQKIEPFRSVLLFTNTRAQAEIWYQALLEAWPHESSTLGLHHGSLERSERTAVEEGIQNGRMRLVVATSSLDLGVDLHPVEAVVQVGSPKSVARFLQRAGRSGHSPGVESIVLFVPTHALEIIEAAALRRAYAEGVIETRRGQKKPLDVLVQYLVSRGSGGGFEPQAVYEEVKETAAFAELSWQEFEWCLDFLIEGGRALGAYKEYKRLVKRDNLLVLEDRQQKRVHQLNIGTIATTTSLRVKYETGGYIGSVEEGFLAGIKPGETFWLGGKPLTLVRIKDITVIVKKAKSKRGRVPRWNGGRMPLSAEFSHFLRIELNRLATDDKFSRKQEREVLKPLLALQKKWSWLPSEDELLVEQIKTSEGWHLFFYPFEGRLVHEGMALLFAHRLAQKTPVTFSLAMNDYGFELLSDSPVTDLDGEFLFSTEEVDHTFAEIVNTTELSRRQFREIAQIAGLVTQGYPGKEKKTKQVHVSASLLFSVFSKYDKENLLLKQAEGEVLYRCLGGSELVTALRRIGQSKVVYREPPNVTPLAFPILVDRLREQVSSERLEDRIAKMLQQLESAGDSTSV